MRKEVEEVEMIKTRVWGRINEERGGKREKYRRERIVERRGAGTRNRNS